jgi:hypothetical protein
LNSQTADQSRTASASKDQEALIAKLREELVSKNKDIGAYNLYRTIKVTD